MNYIDYIASTIRRALDRLTLAAPKPPQVEQPERRYSPYDEPWIELPWDLPEPLQLKQPDSHYNRADQTQNLCLGDVAEHDLTLVTEGYISFLHCRRCGDINYLD